MSRSIICCAFILIAPVNWIPYSSECLRQILSPDEANGFLTENKHCWCFYGLPEMFMTEIVFDDLGFWIYWKWIQVGVWSQIKYIQDTAFAFINLLLWCFNVWCLHCRGVQIIFFWRLGPVSVTFALDISMIRMCGVTFGLGARRPFTETHCYFTAYATPSMLVFIREFHLICYTFFNPKF